MPLSDLGIGSGDFISNELADFGTVVTINHEFGTTDFRGNRTTVFGTGTSIRVVFHVRSKTRVRGKDGFIDLAPAYMMSEIESGIARDDKVTLATGSEWKVWNTLNRDGVFVFSDCYQWDD